MRAFRRIAVILVVGLSLSTVARAQSLESALASWEAVPEDLTAREYCSNTLRYSTTITNLRNQGASLTTLLRWAEQESERSAAEMPSEELLPIGTMLSLIVLIRQSYQAPTIYQHIKGGFPQYAYRSCLKGRPLK
jgi:hypothetical protein